MVIDERSIYRRLDPRTLQYFMAVCEHGSLQRAADHESIAPSALSKRLADLEHAVRTPLLYRHARGMTATPAGQALLHHARVVLFKLDKMHSEMSEYSTGARGHVRLHANVSAIIEFLPEDLAGFVARNPEIRVALEEHVSTQVIRAVQDGEADLGIANPQVNMSEVQRRPYRSDRLVLAVPRQHRLALLPSVRFVDTLDDDHVGLPSNSALHLAMRRAAAEVGMPIRLRIQVGGLDAMCRMIHNGLGIGVLPDLAFALLRSTGDLVAVPLVDSWAERTLYLVARDFSALPLVARILAEHLCTPCTGALLMPVACLS